MSPSLSLKPGAYFTRRHNPDHRRDSLIRQLHDLGYRVTLEQVAA